jgi:hypothetical protein
MKKRLTSSAIVLFLMALSLAASSCSLGNRLALKSAEEQDVTGTFRLILYGCTHYDDLETIAILDKEGDRFAFEPFAPDFIYRVKKGVTAKTALSEAKQFANCHNAFRRTQLSRLVDASGETLGFEMRPLYMPFVFGVEDVLRTDYRIEDDKIIVTIRLAGSVEETPDNSGSRGKER